MTGNAEKGSRLPFLQTVRQLPLLDRAALLLTLLAACMLLVDPVVATTARTLDPEVRSFFRSFTDLGKSGWILVPTALAALWLHHRRRRADSPRLSAAYGRAGQLALFTFAAVGGASLLSSLVKNILGRARPKHLETLGVIEFRPFVFEADFAGLPSGHATTIMALAGVLIILWPRRRVLILVLTGWIAATRFLIGAHYVSDVVAGAALGLGFVHWLRGRLAARRMLFVPGPTGAPRLKGGRAFAWAGHRARGMVAAKARRRE